MLFINKKNTISLIFIFLTISASTSFADINAVYGDYRPIGYVTHKWKDVFPCLDKGNIMEGASRMLTGTAFLFIRNQAKLCAWFEVWKRLLYNMDGFIDPFRGYNEDKYYFDSDLDNFRNIIYDTCIYISSSPLANNIKVDQNQDQLAAYLQVVNASKTFFNSQLKTCRDQGTISKRFFDVYNSVMNNPELLYLLMNIDYGLIMQCVENTDHIVDPNVPVLNSDTVICTEDIDSLTTNGEFFSFINKKFHSTSGIISDKSTQNSTPIRLIPIPLTDSLSQSDFTINWHLIDYNTGNLLTTASKNSDGSSIYVLATWLKYCGSLDDGKPSNKWYAYDSIDSTRMVFDTLVPEQKNHLIRMKQQGTSCLRFVNITPNMVDQNSTIGMITGPNGIKSIYKWLTGKDFSM